jgi:hypothetical protein
VRPRRMPRLAPARLKPRPKRNSPTGPEVKRIPLSGFRRGVIF